MRLETGVICLGLALLTGRISAQTAVSRPNILVAISDDQSWLHTGAQGDPIVKTPHFDRIAREGVRFNHFHANSPSCSPSRAALLTGRNFWELGQGSVLWAVFPNDLVDYPDMLEAAGYAIAYGGSKGWGPGAVAEGGRNPAGPLLPFKNFIDSLPPDKPFCFWFGSQDPHRDYDKGSGARAGLDPAKVKVPPHLPDAPEVRNDILDYLLEIQRFDSDLGAMLKVLEDKGLLANTVVVVTSDNGMPFPRSKANLYDFGTRVPLAIRWPGQVIGGRVIDDFVNATDLAPTFLDAAGVAVPTAYRGRSLLSLLKSHKSGRIDSSRGHTVSGLNRHSYAREDRKGYSMRAIRTYEYLYIRNFLPDRWPAGNPPTYADTDDGPSKAYLLAQQNAPGVSRYFHLAFDIRPGEELYDLRQDSGQLYNVAGLPAYQAIRQDLSNRLLRYLEETGDPMFQGKWDIMDAYPASGGSFSSTTPILPVPPGAPYVLPAPFSHPVPLADPVQGKAGKNGFSGHKHQGEWAYDGQGVVYQVEEPDRKGRPAANRRLFYPRAGNGR